MKTYPLADFLRYEEQKQLGVTTNGHANVHVTCGTTGRHVTCGTTGERLHVCAVPTGEKRAPRRNEWYLSGALVAAYRAASDYSQAYHIATIVLVREVTTHEIVRRLSPAEGTDTDDSETVHAGRHNPGDLE